MMCGGEVKAKRRKLKAKFLCVIARNEATSTQDNQRIAISSGPYSRCQDPTILLFHD